MARSIRVLIMLTIVVVLLITFTVIAQVQRDAAQLTNWAVPLYWQPSPVENQKSRAKSDEHRDLVVTPSPNEMTEPAQAPPNSLVFVGMTPCRIVDTRDATFPAGFGPPILSTGAVRTFVIQSPSSRCPVPSIAQAYSFNITIVLPGFVDFVTVSPTPLSTIPPTFSTLNGYVNTVIANAAIVPAGTNGSVDVYASQNTHFLIHMNGYYAMQSGITLTQGTSAAPSLSFAGNPQTGAFSPAPIL